MQLISGIMLRCLSCVWCLDSQSGCCPPGVQEQSVQLILEHETSTATRMQEQSLQLILEQETSTATWMAIRLITALTAVSHQQL